MSGHLWAPVYETLYQGDKRGLSHAARGVFVGLLIEAKRARSRGVVALPRGETHAAAGIRDLIGGVLEEVTRALTELLAEPDPMLCIEGHPGRLVCRVLSWSPRWVLGEEPYEHARPSRPATEVFDLRVWREANGVTQLDVARLLGLTRTRVTDIEAGRRRLREEEVAKLTAHAARTTPASHDIVTRHSDIEADIAPTSRPTLPRHCPDIGSDMSGRVGGERGGLSPQEKREEKKREEESERRARTTPASHDIVTRHSDIEADIAPTSRPTLPRHCPDIVTTDNLTASELLASVATVRCLAPLLADAKWAEAWAEDTACGLATTGTRSQDALAAVGEYVVQRAVAAAQMSRKELAEDLGRFLKMAKRHGDIARARARRRDGAEADRLERGDAELEAWTAQRWREARRKRGLAAQDPDPRYIAELCAVATTAAGDATPDATGWRPEPREVVASWVRRYLAEPQERAGGVIDAGYPLAWLPGRCREYPLPTKADVRRGLPAGGARGHGAPSQAGEAPSGPPPDAGEQGTEHGVPVPPDFHQLPIGSGPHGPLRPRPNFGGTP